MMLIGGNSAHPIRARGMLGTYRASPMASHTLILSDLHLGRPRLAALSAAALRPLWQDCSRLIINGDIAEVHHPLHWSVAARQVLHLHDLCETDGVELTLLSGNHDPYLTDTRHLELANGAIFVTHGDVLHPAIAPWSPRAGIMRDAHARAIEAIPPGERSHLDTRLKVSQFASHVEWSDMAHEAAKSSVPQMLLRPWSVPQVLWYWWRFPRMASAFLRDHAPDARIGVFGHTHRAGIWTMDDRVIINTGAFGFPGKPWAVEIEEERIVRVRGIECDGTTYRLTRQPIREWPIPATDAASDTKTLAA